MEAWSRKTLKNFEKFLRFFGKTTPYSKIFKILFWKFSSYDVPPMEVSLSNFVKFGRREIGEIMRFYMTKNFACPYAFLPRRKVA